ncbi:succinylglutamate desuccinylase/aspartoacylase family protein [Paeniroseomonas aquatica]|uniref:succinylglutamate desuccinylase/aspartoacylase domain-containing protein n=1 Tax=Paeniroseomonas aquatica TaxID=373043 RepID=UPI003607A7F0
MVALVHGNEIGGALVLDRWLRAGLRPKRGRLSLVFANIDAYARFDPEDPTASRFLDEDLNRLWELDTLEGGRRSSSCAGPVPCGRCSTASTSCSTCIPCSGPPSRCCWPGRRRGRRRSRCGSACRRWWWPMTVT